MADCYPNIPGAKGPDGTSQDAADAIAPTVSRLRRDAMIAPCFQLYKGQHYSLTGTVPHTCRDGRETELEVWRSTCANCGEPFDCMRPAKAKRFEPNRRCQKHKRPGQRVKGGAE
jgi:hypothetical protein